MKKLYIICLALSLGACASYLTKKDYAQGDLSDAEFEKLSAACELESHKANDHGGHYSGTIVGEAEGRKIYNRIFDACMRSKGVMRGVASE